MIKWKINLINNISFDSNNYNWHKLPNIAIKSIELFVHNKRILVEGFEQYLIIKTEYKFLQKSRGTLLDTVNILGKKNNKVYQLSYHRKGKIFQCTNKFPEWTPLNLIPLPAINKKKRFEIKPSKSLLTNINDWHHGVCKNQVSIQVKSI